LEKPITDFVRQKEVLINTQQSADVEFLISQILLRVPPSQKGRTNQTEKKEDVLPLCDKILTLIFYAQARQLSLSEKFRGLWLLAQQSKLDTRADLSNLAHDVEKGLLPSDEFPDDKGGAQTHFDLAISLNELGNLEAAIEEAEIAEELFYDPNQKANCLVWLSALHKEMGNYDLARNTLSVALALQTSDPEITELVQKLLTEIQAKLGNESKKD
jgi:tetratricopeptide (TPR) repeat protein